MLTLSQNLLFCQVYVRVNKDNFALTPYPFKVVSCHNLLSLDGLQSYKGYAVLMRVHPCDILGEGKKKRFKCSCRRISSTTLCITAPSVDYSDAGYDDDQMTDTLASGAIDDANDCIIEGIVNARTHYQDTERTGTMQFHLIFERVTLDESVLKMHEGMKNNELRTESLPVEAPVSRLASVELDDVVTRDAHGTERTTKAFKVTHYASPRVFWRIADTNEEVRKNRRTSNDDDDDDAFAASFLKGAKIS